MPASLALLKIVGKALGNAIGGGLVGDLLVDVLPEVSQNVWEWWTKDRNADERKKDFEDIAGTDVEEVRVQVADIVLEVAGDKSPETQIVLKTYLNQVPGAI